MQQNWKFGDYEFRVMEDFKNEPQYEKLRDLLLPTPPAWTDGMSDEERAKHDALSARMKDLLVLRIAVYHGSTLVGFTRGVQSDSETFHMIMSGVHADHRRNGIYSELLRAVLEYSKDQGFQCVESFHRTSNNPVIIAKLQAGFVITAVVVSEAMGTLTRLIYFHRPEQKKLMDVRCGQIRPDERLRELYF